MELSGEIEGEGESSARKYFYEINVKFNTDHRLSTKRDEKYFR
jgi:hypothetical protein